MAVIFPRWTNFVPLVLALGAPVGAVAAMGGVWYWFSPKFTDVGYQPEQPVAFSHALHAGSLGLDCRYCHSTVERSDYAAIPPTETCMNCHSVVGTDSELLEPVRESAATGDPIAWTKVHLLPDYAFFSHQVHVASGVGCVECHGRVDEMEVVRQVETLSMSWCLDCHRDPTPNLRPRDQVTNMSWDAVAAGYDPQADPARGGRDPKPPMHCSGCHR